MSFEFRCGTCGEIHHGMPGFAADAPLNFYAIPEAERALRCRLSTDACVIDRSSFYVRGCLELPVKGVAEPLVWGAWVSLSAPNFRVYNEALDRDVRSDIGPFFGWFNNRLKPYPDTANLKTRVHLRDHGVRPRIELEPTDHPLAIEQREGISSDRVAEIYAVMMHGVD